MNHKKFINEGLFGVNIGTFSVVVVVGAARLGWVECKHGGQWGQREHKVGGQAGQTTVLSGLWLPEGRGKSGKMATSLKLQPSFTGTDDSVRVVYIGSNIVRESQHRVINCTGSFVYNSSSMRFLIFYWSRGIKLHSFTSLTLPCVCPAAVCRCHPGCWPPRDGYEWHIWPLRQGLPPPRQEEEIWN